MDAEGSDAHILKALSDVDDGFVFFVEPEASLHGDRERGTFDECVGDADHFGDIVEDAAAGAFASDFADGATPVDVDEIGLLRFHDFEASKELVLIGAEDLDTEWALRVVETHFAETFFGFAVERFGSDELGDKEVGPKLLAQRAEGEVGHIIHRRKAEHTIFSEVQRFHNEFAKVRKKMY